MQNILIDCNRLQLLTSAHIDQTLTLYEEECSVDEQSSVVISEIKDRDYLNIEYKNTDESIDENIVIFEVIITIHFFDRLLHFLLIILFNNVT